MSAGVSDPSRRAASRSTGSRSRRSPSPADAVRASSTTGRRPRRVGAASSPSIGEELAVDVDEEPALADRPDEDRLALRDADDEGAGSRPAPTPTRSSGGRRGGGERGRVEGQQVRPAAPVDRSTDRRGPASRGALISRWREPKTDDVADALDGAGRDEHREDRARPGSASGRRRPGGPRAAPRRARGGPVARADRAARSGTASSRQVRRVRADRRGRRNARGRGDDPARRQR